MAPKPDDIELGRRIRAARKAAGLTQASAAERAKIQEETLRAIEAGKRGPSRAVLRRLADALGVTAARLLGSDDEKLTGIDLEAAQLVHDLPPPWQAFALTLLRGLRERVAVPASTSTSTDEG